VLLGVIFWADVLTVSENDPLELVVPNISSISAEVDELTNQSTTGELSSPFIFSWTLSPFPVANADIVGVAAYALDANNRLIATTPTETIDAVSLSFIFLILF
jgi:hypothetical protein